MMLFFNVGLKPLKKRFFENISGNMHFMTETPLTRIIPDQIFYRMVYLQLAYKKPWKTSLFFENVQCSDTK